MIEVEFNIRVDDAESLPDRLMDDYELAIMLEQTKAQITKQVQASLGELRCAEHDQPPRVIVSGAYSTESEQLELQYNIDTCCKRFLMEAVHALNRS
ncbi:MAG: hypothetical protein SF029_16060 [bacterium]|nr:hypothetical protein [bacterium]